MGDGREAPRHIVTPDDSWVDPALRAWVARVPRTGYGGANKDKVLWMPKAERLRASYVRVQHPDRLGMIVVGADHARSDPCYPMDVGLPPPNLAVGSYAMQAAWPDADGGSRLWHGADGRRWREREIAAQRCHYVYLLKEPVTRPRDGRKVSPRAMKPMWYYNQVAAGLTAALSGDRGFRGYVSKNPLRCDLWHVVAYRSEPYKLADLAAHVDIGVDGAANWIDKTPVPGRTVAEKAAALHDWLEEHYPSDDGVFFVLRTAAYKAMDDIVAETSSRPVAELELASQLADAAEELRHRTGCHHAWVEMVAQRVADYVCRNHSRDRAGFTALRGINRGAMGLTGSPDLSLTNRQKMAGRYTARKRAQSAQTKVRRAEERLRKRGERPTAAGVAREAGVARQTAGKHMTTERRPGRPVAA